MENVAAPREIHQNQGIQIISPTTTSTSMQGCSIYSVSNNKLLEAHNISGNNSVQSPSSCEIVSGSADAEGNGTKISMTETSDHPLIIGNIRGANLLTAAVMNKQDASPQTITIPSVLSGQLINVLPLYLQDSANVPVQRKESSIPLPAGTSVSCTTEFPDNSANKRKRPMHTNAVSENSHSKSHSDSEIQSRSILSSSDTIIISTTSLGASDNVPLSSPSFASNDSFVGRILQRDRSSVTSEKPFSLLTNISDRSVSLESIPSISLFKQDPDSIANFSFIKSEADEIPECDGTSAEVPVLEDLNRSLADGMVVVGSDKVPQSVIVLMKPQRGNIFSTENKEFCTMAPSEICKQDKRTPQHNSAVPLGHPNHSQNDIQEKQKEHVAEKNGDTDTGEESADAIGDNCKKSSLSRADTVILDANINNPPSSELGHELPTSDTVILSSVDREEHSDERLSEGFSFTSFTVDSVDPSSLEVQVSEPQGNNSVAVGNTSHSSISQTLAQYPLTMGINNHLNKSLYVLTNDGQLTAVKCISADQLDIATLSQLGLLNDVTSLPQSMSQCFSVNLPEVIPRNMEVKETQTELVFGANTVYFRPVDNLSQGSVYNLQQLPNTVPTSTLSIGSSAVSAMINTSSGTLQIHQPQVPVENVQRTVVSLADRAAPETIGESNTLQCFTQDTKYGITPPQTSEPQLPGPSSLVLLSPDTLVEEDSRLFKCIECQESFKTKQELHIHGKTHKRIIKCDLCNATFTRMGNFNRHRKIHNLQPESQTAFRCNDCGREFLQRCDLKRHLLIHTKQEPHRCEKCGKGYIRRSDLVVHMRFHNKDKAFKCTMCDKRYHQTGDLGRHIRQAHKPNSMLTCGHCDRKYACESTLIRHMKAVHKDIILHTVNQKLQDASDKSPTLNTKDVLFTMTQKAVDGKQ